MQVTSSYRDIFRIATPVIFGGVSQTVINITDSIFLGRVGETELAASALGGIFYFVLYMVGFGFSNP